MPTTLLDSTVTANQGVFLRSKGEGLLDGDPGEEEATIDDNSVVALHPDTMEHLQLSHSTWILPRLP